MENSRTMHDYLPQNSINNLFPGIDPDIEPQIDSFMNRDISMNTKKAIQSDLKGFFHWYFEINHEPFSFNRLTLQEGVEFKDHCISKNQKPATINRKLITLKALCTFALENGLLKKNPFQSLKCLSTQPLAPKSLGDVELRRLVKEVLLRGSPRDQLIFFMMLEGGFRVSELIYMICGDISLSERTGQAKVRNGKGNKTRVVPLNNRLRHLLEEYLRGRSPEDKLLYGQRGALSLPVSVNKIIEVYAKFARVHCTPHTLRHTFAYNFLQRNDQDIVSLAQILGHSNINTTAIYTQNRFEDLQRKVEVSGVSPF